VKVVVSSAEGTINAVALRGITMLGRTPGSDIVLRDAKVSRRHAVIHKQRDGTLTLVDLGSVNGTYLNGRRLVLPARLHVGDTVRMGGTTLSVVDDEERRGESSRTDNRTDETTTQINLEQRHVTVLVVDVRGYTALSEHLALEQLSQLIGRWFRSVASLVQRHEGFIDKFIGDGVMAIWIAPADDPAPSIERAVGAALDLYRESIALGRQVAFWPKGEQFEVGIGINTGTAVLGTLATELRREYTATGDTVNVAFRLEPLTKIFPYPIIVSEETVRLVRARYPFALIGTVGLTGRSKPVTVYGLKPADTP
jgi:adenylate cyclase